MVIVLKWIRSRPVTAFFAFVGVLTAISWGPLMVHERGLINLDLPQLFFLGGVAPGLAAYAVMRVLRGKQTVTELLGPLLRWRVGLRWYLVAVLMFILIWAVATTLAGNWSQEWDNFGSWPAVLVGSAWYLFAAIPEEVGWRGFAVPALQERSRSCRSLGQSGQYHRSSRPSARCHGSGWPAVNGAPVHTPSTGSGVGRYDFATPLMMSSKRFRLHPSGTSTDNPYGFATRSKRRVRESPRLGSRSMGRTGKSTPPARCDWNPSSRIVRSAA
jgi:hypothetical protein